MTTLMTSKQVSRIWTTFNPKTIRRWAVRGKLPVAAWVGSEPLFTRDEKTLRAFRRLTHARTK
jgi:hypothetical protein